MKKYILTLAAAMAAFAFSSCDKDTTDGLTFIEDFPVFTDATGAAVDGTEVMLALGDEYDATYYAKFGDEDVTSQTTMTIVDMNGDEVDAVSTDAPGLYTISYTGESKHKLSSWTATRKVFVYDPTVTTSIAGTYSMNMDESYREIEGTQKTFSAEAETREFSGVTKVTFTELCPGFYSVSDLIGGWYDQLRGYNESYPGQFTMNAYVCLNSDNSLTLLSSSFEYTSWGAAGADSMTAAYNPDDSSITMDVEVSGWGALFHIILK